MPNCGGGIIEQHYIITQEAAGGGNVCPDFVRQNTTEMIECCREYTFCNNVLLILFIATFQSHQQCFCTCVGCSCHMCRVFVLCRGFVYTLVISHLHLDCSLLTFTVCSEPMMFMLFWNCSLGNCEWRRVQTGRCVPNCGGGVIQQNYIITQEAAGGGNDCPDFVRQNTTEMIECCRKLSLFWFDHNPKKHVNVTMFFLGNCEWGTVETGECVPNCGGGEKWQHYVITQKAAGGGTDCPNFVRDNVTKVLECCGKWCSYTYQSVGRRSM